MTIGLLFECSGIVLGLLAAIWAINRQPLENETRQKAHRQSLRHRVLGCNLSIRVGTAMDGMIVRCGECEGYWLIPYRKWEAKKRQLTSAEAMAMVICFSP
jgi:hypothetical protein